MKGDNWRFILGSFVTWRLFLFGVVFLAAGLFPFQKDFLGGGLSNYLKNPYFWSWLNFDGEHYAAIAHQGYQPLTYFFFPLFPLVTRIAASLINPEYITIAFTGLLISNLSFLVGLIGLWKLIRLDYNSIQENLAPEGGDELNADMSSSLGKPRLLRRGGRHKENIAKMTLLLLILFPTSFYFGAFYTESLTLALIVWSFYFARKRSWIFAGVLGAFATATRITALALVPAIAVEYFYKKSPFTNHPARRSYASSVAGGYSLITAVNLKKIVSLLLIPLGLAAYMYYLYRITGDPLEFVHNVSIFGQQRSSTLILLPQVFYRYFFKVLPSLNYNYFPIVFTTYLEIASAIIFGILGVWSFFKLRLGYSLFLAAGYLIPPLSGSFSSFPRYVLILFPAYILMALWLNKKSKLVKGLVYLTLLFLAAISLALFSRGYWVS
ncbi:hypothetical protein A2V97_00940 [Candidatus Woesebacteria bacterium RBG_16_42_24]|uniref:Glycosyltransferase RgtA/B/C/D-like domain-containing protein n=1 Tax=Candidatus Woesebacteria bacterium RBG_16_42_24 TaxID=1802485 RepID=A0A1F7XMV1_9BACT|nr:MAG: hypothetical protein A2V97_00940 [Candidatus Woesebacteria bacterium RBG_16_42_24]